MLFHPLDGILGSITKVRLVRALLSRTAPVSGREAQRLAHVRSREGTSVALADLAELGIVHRTELRGSHLYVVNREHHLVPLLVELFGEEETRLRHLVSALEARLSEAGLTDRVLSLVLYGSNAREDAAPGSDEELLVVVESAEEVGEMVEFFQRCGHELLRRYGLRIAAYVITERRLSERAESGDPLVAAVRAGRVLMGAAPQGIPGPA